MIGLRDTDSDIPPLKWERISEKNSIFMLRCLANGVKDMILPAALLLMLIVAQVVLDRVQEDTRSAEMFYVVYSWDVVGDIYDK